MRCGFFTTGPITSIDYGPITAGISRMSLMQTRSFGRPFRLQVSALDLGCMGMSEFYGRRDDNQAIAIMRHAIDRGITLFDTADMYGIGHDEELLGRAVRHARDRLVIATKPAISVGKRHGFRARISDAICGSLTMSSRWRPRKGCTAAPLRGCSPRATTSCRFRAPSKPGMSTRMLALSTCLSRSASLPYSTKRSPRVPSPGPAIRNPGMRVLNG
jgi:hypothetical protein